MDAADGELAGITDANDYLNFLDAEMDRLLDGDDPVVTAEAAKPEPLSLAQSLASSPFNAFSVRAFIPCCM